MSEKRILDFKLTQNERLIDVKIGYTLNPHSITNLSVCHSIRITEDFLYHPTLFSLSIVYEFTIIAIT